MNQGPSPTSTEGLAGASLPWRRRWPAVGTVGLVAALAVWAGHGDPRGWVAAAAALGTALFTARRVSGRERLLGWGAAIVFASIGPRGGALDLDASLTMSGIVGQACCALAAALTLRRTPPSGGVVRVPAASPRLAVAALVFLGAVPLAAFCIPAGQLPWLTEVPREWAALSSLGTVGVLAAEVAWASHLRRLELGMLERTRATLALIGVSLAVAVAAAMLGGADLDALGRLMVVLVAVSSSAVSLDPDGARVERAARIAVLFAVSGIAVATMGTVLAPGGDEARQAALVTAAVALLVGAAATAWEARRQSLRGPWLDGFARAVAAASRPEPDDAIRDGLVALRWPGSLSAQSPELWTLTPPRAFRVDAAGYLHDRDAVLPDLLVATALREPEATLRAELLQALEVRRPDLRPLSSWLGERGFALAAVVARGAEVDGVLLLPKRPGNAPATLEEVRAFKGLADRLAAACQSRATREHLLVTAHDAARRADATGERIERLEHEHALRSQRDAFAATRLARPATVGVYSAGSRMALEALELRTRSGGPIAVVAPSGVDPVPHLARAHLAGPRSGAPLVLVDATSAREHDSARWLDPQASPLALADRGLLVLLDGCALPADVQQLVARALAERRAPWERPEPLDIQLAWTGVAPPEEMLACGRLDPALAHRLGDACEAPVVLPRLRDRVEDLRTIITDRLAREGLRVFGRPVGIEHAAYARLVEHPFPGEEAELAVLIQRLVARCAGDVVRASDVDAVQPALHETPKEGPGRRKGPVSA